MAASVASSSGQGTVNEQDVHSVPDSPMLEDSSSFGSTSSSPSLVNLPSIRVHVEDGIGGEGEDLGRVQAGEMGRVAEQSLGPGIALNIGAMRRCSEARLHPCKFLHPKPKFIQKKNIY
ncbi:hypothetical protein FF1_014777 [Malus domestica]